VLFSLLFEFGKAALDAGNAAINKSLFDIPQGYGITPAIRPQVAIPLPIAPAPIM